MVAKTLNTVCQIAVLEIPKAVKPHRIQTALTWRRIKTERRKPKESTVSMKK